MSRYLGKPYDCDFELGETVAFDHNGDRLIGKVVRVYNTRLVYHIEVEGRRYYEVEVPDDNLKRVGVES